MRSEIVLGALETQNAFALCHRAFKLVRKSHKPSTRIQETKKIALQNISEVERNAARAPEETQEPEELSPV